MGVALAAALLVTTSGTLDAGAQAPRVHPITPPHHPLANFRLASLTRVLASIDTARRAEEGLGPLRFDATRFSRLSVAHQVFVLSNLERTTRGLSPVAVDLSGLDALAQFAARRDADPIDPGRAYWSLWSSAPASYGQFAFFADFGWVYDDGPPPQYIFRNVDCTRAGERGCWGHRDNLLVRLPARSRCRQELVAGTGFAPRSVDGPSLTEIIEPRCVSSVPASAYTWREAVAEVRIPPSEATP